MQIIDHDLETKIKNDIVNNALQGEYTKTINHTSNILGALYDNIPENKRASFGRVYIVQLLSKYLFSSLVELGANVLEIGEALFERSKDFQNKGVALGILSFYGIEDYEKVLPYFEASASSTDWNMREFAQMFFRKLIQKWPDQMNEYLLKLQKIQGPQHPEVYQRNSSTGKGKQMVLQKTRLFFVNFAKLVQREFGVPTYFRGK